MPGRRGQTPACYFRDVEGTWWRVYDLRSEATGGQPRVGYMPHTVLGDQRLFIAKDGRRRITPLGHLEDSRPWPDFLTAQLARARPVGTPLRPNHE